MGREIDPELDLLQNLLLFTRRDTMQVFFSKRLQSTLRIFFVAMLTGSRSSPLQEDKDYMLFLQPIIFPFLAESQSG
jgi:hypothetical protein